jgi:hypothetical protein
MTILGHIGHQGLTYSGKDMHQDQPGDIEALEPLHSTNKSGSTGAGFDTTQLVRAGEFYSLTLAEPQEEVCYTAMLPYQDGRITQAFHLAKGYHFQIFRSGETRIDVNIKIPAHRLHRSSVYVTVTMVFAIHQCQECPLSLPQRRGRDVFHQHPELNSPSFLQVQQVAHDYNYQIARDRVL